MNDKEQEYSDKDNQVLLNIQDEIEDNQIFFQMD
jgi:hypothetical protein